MGFAKKKNHHVVILRGVRGTNFLLFGTKNKLLPFLDGFLFFYFLFYFFFFGREFFGNEKKKNEKIPF